LANNFDLGKYTRAPDDAQFAYIKINKMWIKPIKAPMNSEEDSTEEGMTQEMKQVL
jgi:hypothetical protein